MTFEGEHHVQGRKNGTGREQMLLTTRDSNEWKREKRGGTRGPASLRPASVNVADE